MSWDLPADYSPMEGPAAEHIKGQEQLVPARMSSSPVGDAPALSIGLVVHLWPKHLGVTAKALCGGFPRGVYSHWRAVEEATDCTVCMRVLSRRAEDLALVENVSTLPRSE